MTLADLPSWSCRALGRINEMDRQGTASVYTQARAVSGLPPMIREQGLRRWNTLFAVRASAICIFCGLSMYEHNAAWRKHGRSCHHSRPETATAIAVWDENTPKQLLKLAVCWLLQPEKRAVSPFQRCQDRGKTVHLAKSLFCHSATSIFERISTSIMAKVLTCVAGLFPQQELCTGPYYKQRACLEVPGACNACKTTCLYDISDCGRLFFRGKRQDSFPQANFVVAPPHVKGATFNLSMSCYFRI